MINIKKDSIRVYLLISIILLVIVSLFSLNRYYSNSFNNNESELIRQYSNKKTYINELNDTEVLNNNVSKDEVLNDKDININNNLESIITNMSLEEKVGQLFIVNLEDINLGEVCTSFNEDIKYNLQKYNVGGVIFFSKNLVNREQVIELIKNIQTSVEIPLFISVDEEGGIVSRLADIPEMKTTKFENMIEIGKSKDYNRAYQVGSTIGREINELGFNLDFAPVADVVTNLDNYEIGVRSFGSESEVVSKMVTNYMKGLQDEHVSATLKHFPGHGDSIDNSHEQATYTNKDLNEMRKVKFLPFKAGIEAGVDFIMVSHISAPNVNGNNEPSSLSKNIITNILRKELKYENIIITDALNMGAITSNYYSGEAAIKAINAGVDILLMSPKFEEVYGEVINAVRSGEIKEERINESVYRILKVKSERGIFN